MKRLIFGFMVGLGLGLSLCPSDPEPAEYCAESMTCSAAKVAASKVCDCQIVCYETGR